MKWNRRKTFIAVPLIVLFVSVVGGWALSRSSDSVDVNLTKTSVEADPTIGTNVANTGKQFSFVELTDNATGEKGTIAPAGKPMVVNFWFSTCEPCKREMPALSAASAKYGKKVDFIGINPNDTTEVATAFLKKYKITYPTFLDDGSQMAKAGVAIMPTTYFLDAKGNIVAQQSGELKTSEIDRIITSDLGVTL